MLHTYNETNAPMLIVRADECFYDASNHLIRSAGPIHMQTADGRFSIEGTGFSFLQQTNSTNSSLIISNNVHTFIQAALLQNGATNRTETQDPTQEGPLVIDSTSFSYDGATGRGIWRDKVRVEGTNLVMNSEVLTADVPMKEGQVRALLAERDVDVKYSGIHATGGRLNYDPPTGLIHLSERAAWDADQRRGGGEELVIDRTNHIFQVNHHAWLRLPGRSAGQSGFLSSPAPATNAAPVTNSVQIVCDNYEIRTNWAVFRRQVRLEEHVGEVLRSTLTCENEMTVTFAGTNELQTLTANKDVVINVKGSKPEEDRRFTGGRAFYTGTNAVLELTKNPTWQAGSSRGKGDVLRIYTAKQEMLVRGNASMRLPANQLAGQIIPPGVNVTTNRPPRTGTNQFAEVFCQEYTLGTNNSVFRGGVYATHPDMNWSCEKLTVQVPGAGITNVIAEQNVVFDVMSQRGPFHGTGDHAIYTFGAVSTATNSLPINELRLTGTPAVLTNAVRGDLRNPLIIWDRARDTLNLPGNEYQIQGLAKVVATNIFVLPNKKRTK